LKGLAGSYKGRGKFDLALKYHLEALEQFERYLPKDHPMVATALREIENFIKDTHSICARFYSLLTYPLYRTQLYGYPWP